MNKLFEQKIELDQEELEFKEKERDFLLRRKRVHGIPELVYDVLDDLINESENHLEVEVTDLMVDGYGNYFIPTKSFFNDQVEEVSGTPTQIGGWEWDEYELLISSSELERLVKQYE